MERRFRSLRLTTKLPIPVLGMFAQKGGVTWVDDGNCEIAIAHENRVSRYRFGIKEHCLALVGRYLPIQDLHLKKRARVVNFGANIGEIAIVFAESGMRVLAIEPDPYALPALYANSNGRNIEVVPVGAWKEDGLIPFYIKTDSADTSAFNVSDTQYHLPVRMIDSIVEERRLDKIDLIIGDAEGAEPEVLEGARETLKRTSYVSVCASNERCGERTLEACEKILLEANFDIIHREDKRFCTLVGSRKT